MKIALFLPNWLGDVVMATPTLRALRHHFGSNTEIVGIMRPYLGDLLVGTNWLDAQWFFDAKSKNRDHRRIALIRRMRHAQFDTALLLPNSFHTACLARLGGARHRVGYARDGRGWLLTHKIYPPREGRRITAAPVVDTFLKLAEAVGCPPESPRLELALTEEEHRLGESIWQKLGLRDDGRVVVLNSSGAYGAAKLWPTEHFGDLARRIASELDHDVLVLCGPAEREIAREIVSRANHSRVVSLADQAISISMSKACIERSRFMVSTDSGPRHIAAAFNKPVITLLGPTVPIWIENPTVRGIELSLDLDCSGCYARTCPKGHHRCMRDLSPNMVYRAVVQFDGENSAAA